MVAAVNNQQAFSQPQVEDMIRNALGRQQPAANTAPNTTTSPPAQAEALHQNSEAQFTQSVNELAKLIVNFGQDDLIQMNGSGHPLLQLFMGIFQPKSPNLDKAANILRKLVQDLTVKTDSHVGKVRQALDNYDKSGTPAPDASKQDALTYAVAQAVHDVQYGRKATGTSYSSAQQMLETPENQTLVLQKAAIYFLNGLIQASPALMPLATVSDTVDSKNDMTNRFLAFAHYVESMPINSANEASGFSVVNSSSRMVLQNPSEEKLNSVRQQLKDSHTELLHGDGTHEFVQARVMQQPPVTNSPQVTAPTAYQATVNPSVN